MHLGQIASTIDLPIETLRQLNPQYKLDIIPATTKPYTLVLPQRNVTQYIAQRACDLQAKDSMPTSRSTSTRPTSTRNARSAAGTVYVVKKGDTLGAIARRYRVTTAQLMRWNRHQERPQTPSSDSGSASKAGNMNTGSRYHRQPRQPPPEGLFAVIRISGGGAVAPSATGSSAAGGRSPQAARLHGALRGRSPTAAA